MAKNPPVRPETPEVPSQTASEPGPARLEGRTIEDWYREAQRLERQRLHLEAERRALAVQLDQIPEATRRLEQFRALTGMAPISEANQPDLLDAERTLQGLRDWLESQKRALAGVLARTYPALRVTNPKGLYWGAGVYAPAGMVYRKDLHGTAFELIVGTFQEGTDYEFVPDPNRVAC